MSRARVKRRARARIDQKEIRDIWRVFADRGLAQRIAAVNRAVAPDSALFWHVFKQRLGARELLRPVTDPKAVAELAGAVLRAEGHDLTGIVLKVTWQPMGAGRGVLDLEAGAEHSLAVGVVEEVQASERGKIRAAARASLR